MHCASAGALTMPCSWRSAREIEERRVLHDVFPCSVPGHETKPGLGEKHSPSVEMMNASMVKGSSVRPREGKWMQTQHPRFHRWVS